MLTCVSCYPEEGQGPTDWGAGSSLAGGKECRGQGVTAGRNQKSQEIPLAQENTDPKDTPALSLASSLQPAPSPPSSPPPEHRETRVEDWAALGLEGLLNGEKHYFILIFCYSFVM